MRLARRPRPELPIFLTAIQEVFCAGEVTATEPDARFYTVCLNVLWSENSARGDTVSGWSICDGRVFEFMKWCEGSRFAGRYGERYVCPARDWVCTRRGVAIYTALVSFPFFGI